MLYNSTIDLIANSLVFASVCLNVRCVIFYSSSRNVAQREPFHKFFAQIHFP